MKSIPRIALTGGPSGGKSTLMSAVQSEVPEAYCVPEAATILLSGGFPAPNERHTWTQEWQDDFQLAVSATQIALENVSLERARAEGKHLLVTDRGLPDAAAYLVGGLHELEYLTGFRGDYILNQYDAVLHLASSATIGSYDKASNPYRIEEAEEALALEKRTLEAWQDHPNRMIVGGQTKAERVTNGLAIIREYL